MDATPDDQVAQLLNQMGAVSSDQLDAAKALQSFYATQGKRVTLGEVLVAQRLITPAMIENAARRLQAQQDGGIRQLGNFKILSRLGEGGMGAVYLAEDIGLQRRVALKVLSPRYATEAEFLSRFRREARAAGKLNHPNIVGAYMVGEDLGNHYYTMEYCEGESLDKLLKRETVLSWDRAVAIVKQAAEGLRYAHDHAIIHRDIKPQNIFITREGVVRIFDLGISKQLGDADASFNTQSGVAVGTPRYMSPEQARCDKSLDGRTDIYSLGATLYHLVTGQTPFKGASAGEIIAKHIAEELPNPLDIRPGIPENVVALIVKMMAKDRADRQPDCTELLADLERVQHRQMPAGTPLEAGKSSVAMRGVEEPEQPAAVDRVPTADRPQRQSGGEARVSKRASVRNAAPAAPAELDEDGATSRGHVPFRGAAPVEGRTADAGLAARTAGGNQRVQFWIISGVSLAALAAVCWFALSGAPPRNSGADQSVNGAPQPPATAHATSDPGEKRLPLNTAQTTESVRNPASKDSDDAFVREVAALPPKQQADRVLARLKELNPGFDGKANMNADYGRVGLFAISSTAVSNISPVGALKSLDSLWCSTPWDKEGKLADLSPLQDLQLRYFECNNNPGITDLSPLRKLKLIELECHKTQISDLSPLKGMPLTRLDIHDTRVSDLSPLRGMPLATLICENTKIVDFSPLQGMPLKALSCDFKPERDADILKGIKTLVQINGKPVAEFWKALRIPVDTAK